PCRWIEERAECYAFFENRVGGAEQQDRCPSFSPSDRRLSHEQGSWSIEPNVCDDLEDELARIYDERRDGGRTREVLGDARRQEQERGQDVCEDIQTLPASKTEERSLSKERESLEGALCAARKTRLPPIGIFVVSLLRFVQPLQNPQRPRVIILLAFSPISVSPTGLRDRSPPCREAL